MTARRFSLDFPYTGAMLWFPTEPTARKAYSESMIPCHLYDRDVCIAEKDWVDIGVDENGNPIYALEEQEQEGDEYVSLEDECLVP